MDTSSRYDPEGLEGQNSDGHVTEDGTENINNQCTLEDTLLEIGRCSYQAADKPSMGEDQQLSADESRMPEDREKQSSSPPAEAPTSLEAEQGYCNGDDGQEKLYETGNHQRSPSVEKDPNHFGDQM